MKNQLTKRLASLGLASLFAVGVLTGCSAPTTTTPPTTQGENTPATQTSPEAPQATSPMGEKKMMDIDGNRYVFLNNGEAFELTEAQLGEKIADKNAGTLFELKGYNSGFRMAFKYQDAFYICENVGKSDDSAMDIAEYLKAADLQKHVVYTDITDHMGASILNMLEQADSVLLLDALANAKVAELTTEEHEGIAKAQSEGLSYKIEFVLDDYTTFTSYIIPSMNYVTIGDYTCTFEDLNEQVGSFFENLVASDNIIYN